MSFFENAIEVFRYWRNKQEIDGAVQHTEELAEKFRRLAASAGGKSSLSAPGFVLDELRVVIESIQIKRIRSWFASGYVGVKNTALNNIWIAFAESAEYVPPKDVLPLSALVARNHVFGSTEPVEARMALRALSELAHRCPPEEKLKLYSTLDSYNDFLPHLVKVANDRHLIVLLLSRCFDGVETEQVQTVLMHSVAWANAPKDQGMAQHLIDQNLDRLLPALNFKEFEEKKQNDREVSGSRKMEGNRISEQKRSLSGKIAEHPIVVGLGIVASIVTVLT
ncbi:MAG: hypothetical protein KDD51_17105, partial [Bdellovibrionales bacterium]|nr:hypothetical protein [Bdellovibrionales bacterium]